MKNTKRTKTLITTTLLIVLAVLFVFIYSFSTSPLFDYYEWVDSSVYKIIGRGWADGLKPYVDLWDQKGPLIYFINAMGYWIAGSDKGVWLVQCAFLFVSLLLTYRFLRSSMRTSISIIFVLLVTIALIQTYDSGNNVEEYSMPFLMASLFGIYSWAEKSTATGDYTHSSKYAALYGITFAVAAAMRLMNAIGVAFAMIVVVVMLIRHGLWKNLAINALVFVGAFIAGVLPFILYYAANDSLNDLWYGAIGFNLEYVQASRVPSTLAEWYTNIRLNMNGYLTILFGITLLLLTRRKLIGAIFILSPLPLITWIIYGLGYEHYSTLLLPYICLLFKEGYTIYQSSGSKRLKQSMSILFTILVLFDCIYAIRITASLPGKNNKDKKELTLYGEIIKSIPNWQTEDIMLYNPHPEAYVIYNLTPQHKFFNGCDFLASVSPTYNEMIKEEYNNNSPKWVIYKTDDSGLFPEHIKPILETKYILVSCHENVNLYRRRKG